MFNVGFYYYLAFPVGTHSLLSKVTKRKVIIQLPTVQHNKTVLQKNDLYSTVQILLQSFQLWSPFIKNLQTVKEN